MLQDSGLISIYTCINVSLILPLVIILCRDDKAATPADRKESSPSAPQSESATASSADNSSKEPEAAAGNVSSEPEKMEH